VADEPAEVVHRFMGCLNRRDLETLLSLFVPGATLDPGLRFGSPCQGIEQIGALFGRYWEAFPELLILVKEVHVGRPGVVAVVDLVAARDLVSATGNGGTPSTARYQWSGVYRFDLEDGHIRGVTIYGDFTGRRWLAGPIPAGGPARPVRGEGGAPPVEGAGSSPAEPGGSDPPRRKAAPERTGRRGPPQGPGGYGGPVVAAPTASSRPDRTGERTPARSDPGAVNAPAVYE
jgi:hypothetical protein